MGKNKQKVKDEKMRAYLGVSKVRVVVGVITVIHIQKHTLAKNREKRRESEVS